MRFEDSIEMYDKTILFNTKVTHYYDNKGFYNCNLFCFCVDSDYYNFSLITINDCLMSIVRKYDLNIKDFFFIKNYPDFINSFY